MLQAPANSAKRRRASFRIKLKYLSTAGGAPAAPFWGRWQSSCRGAPSQKLSLQALFSLIHCPVVVHREDGLEQKRKVAEQRLVRSYPPVIDDTNVRSSLFESPNSSSHEIAERFDGESVRPFALDDAKLPFQSVRQPPFRVQPHDPSDAVRRARLDH